MSHFVFALVTVGIMIRTVLSPALAQPIDEASVPTDFDWQATIASCKPSKRVITPPSGSVPFSSTCK